MDRRKHNFLTFKAIIRHQCSPYTVELSVPFHNSRARLDTACIRCLRVPSQSQFPVIRPGRERFSHVKNYSNSKAGNCQSAHNVFFGWPQRSALYAPTSRLLNRCTHSAGLINQCLRRAEPCKFFHLRRITLELDGGTRTRDCNYCG